MVIVIGNVKGGSAKSTTSINLSCWLSDKKKKVLLLDTDHQATAQTFTQVRAQWKGDGNEGYSCLQVFGKQIRSQILNLKESFDHIIVDVGGRDTLSFRAALTVADLLLIPVVPRGFDVWALDAIAELIEEAQAVNDRFQAQAFITKADAQGKDNKETLEHLQTFGQFTTLPYGIGNRKAIATASEHGMSIFEWKPKDQKAIDETTTLFNHIIKIN